MNKVKMSRNGLFITFEGGEGAGKTTLINKIEKALIEQGYSVLKTREPGGSLLSEEIRSLVLSHKEGYTIAPTAELLLFLAARAQHLEEKIRPALEQGKIVLCDRFNDSTIVYQGIARQLGQDFVTNLCHLVCNDTQVDLTLLLDIDPSLGLKRVQEAYQAKGKEVESQDRIELEKIDFHIKIRKGFLSLANKEPERIKIIDASLSKSQVVDQALEYISAFSLPPSSF